MVGLRTIFLISFFLIFIIGCGAEYDYDGSSLICYRPNSLTEAGFVVEYELRHSITKIAIYVRESNGEWRKLFDFIRLETARDYMEKLVDICTTFGGIIEEEDMK